ncbi:MAG: presenilin family intramembrane aspartyl protease PSH [Halobacteriaceae archaeon]
MSRNGDADDAGPPGGTAADGADESPDGTAEPAAGGRGAHVVAGMAALFLATVLCGVALSLPFEAAGLQQFENPSSLGNTGLIVVEILVFTAIFLVALRYDRGVLVVRGLVLLAFGVMFSYPLRVALPAGVPVGAAYLGGLLCMAVLWVHPEWYVLDAAAVVGGAVIIGLFGVSLSVLPALALLAVLAVYDAYSVYVSEHMQSLAGGVIDLAVPMVFVVPATREFSIREAEDMAAASSQAMFLGVGDAAIPGLLAVSANTYLATPSVVAGLNLPALGALVGSVVGLGALFVLLFRVERAHAGLPALNGCVIAGYLAGALAAGLSLPTALGLGGAL